MRILTIFGTRPEIIKLAPVIRRFERYPDGFQTINVASSQHTSLLHPFVEKFGIRIDHDLDVMRPDQSPHHVGARVLESLHPVLQSVQPDIVMVQGDTTTTLAGALAGFYSSVPVAHVEAGLRTGNPLSPFPEEMNRRLVTRLAALHFAATEHNRATLLDEGIEDDTIFVTGNPVVDALHHIIDTPGTHGPLEKTLRDSDGTRRILLTTHRRESLGETMRGNLEVLRRFVARHEDVSLIFPVHPNPSVRDSACRVLADQERVHLIDPLDYEDFVRLMSESWLIVSDSGGVQEEAPTLGKPVLILRENTERPEAVEAGVAKLVGGNPDNLAKMLEEIDADPSWVESVKEIDNPFGDGQSAQRIVSAVANFLGVHTPGIMSRAAHSN